MREGEDTRATPAKVVPLGGEQCTGKISSMNLRFLQLMRESEPKIHAMRV